MLREVIICDKCGHDDCRVERLVETEKVSMSEYAKRHRFPKDLYSWAMDGLSSIKRFLITCQKCGHQLEYFERPERPQPIQFDIQYSSEVEDYDNGNSS